MSDETTLQNWVPNAEQTPDSENKAPETSKSDDGKGDAMVPSGRLREEAEKRRNIEAEFEAYKIEQSQLRERDIAAAKYGSDIVNDEKVQELREKHTTLSWDEVIVLAGKNKSNRSPEAPKFVGRNPNDILKNDKELLWKDIVKLPQPERIELQKKAKKGEVKIIY